MGDASGLLSGRAFKLSSVSDSSVVPGPGPGPDPSTGSRFPWPPGCATGIGSLPGTDPAEAMRIVLGELPDLPHLVELPARGPAPT